VRAVVQLFYMQYLGLKTLDWQRIAILVSTARHPLFSSAGEIV